MFSGGKHMEHWIKPLSTNPRNGLTHSNNSSALLVCNAAVYPKLKLHLHTIQKKIIKIIKKFIYNYHYLGLLLYNINYLQLSYYYDIYYNCTHVVFALALLFFQEIAFHTNVYYILASSFFVLELTYYI